MKHATMHPRIACAAMLAIALAACGGKPDEDGNAATPVEALPQPEQPSGSVTGMPTRPGPGEVPIGGEPPPQPPLLQADARFGMPLLEENPETGLDEAADGTATSSEPTPADAIAVLRQYFSALATRDFARAHGLWSDEGRASGQTLDQFSASFALAKSIDAQVGEPGAVDAAAGSRFIEIPVVLRTTQADGSVRTQAGRIVLRRTVVDGASAAQRAWRISSMDLRDAAG